MKRYLIATIIAFLATAPVFLAGCRPGDGFDEAAGTITASGLGQGIADLAADSMGGRAPSTWGEERTVRYLQGRFEALGLEPGNGAGWVQEVPLVALTPGPRGRSCGAAVPSTAWSTEPTTSR